MIIVPIQGTATLVMFVDFVDFETPCGRVPSTTDQDLNTVLQLYRRGQWGLGRLLGQLGGVWNTDQDQDHQQVPGHHLPSGYVKILVYYGSIWFYRDDHGIILGY